MRKLHRVVCATGFSTTSEAAWDEARRLGRLFDAEIVAVHAVEATPILPVEVRIPPHVYEQILASARRDAEAGLDRLLGSVVGSGLKVRIRQEEGPVVQRILDVVTEEAADLLVVGTHGRRGLDRAVLGSVADRLLRQASCPLVTVRATLGTGTGQPIRRICYATDFSPTARAAWSLAAAIASAAGAEIDFVHVVFEPAVDRHISADTAARMAQHFYEQGRLDTERFLEGAGLPRNRVRVHLLQGLPDEQIVRCARERAADLIVMGTHGWSGLLRWMLGSAAHHVIRSAPCPVLTVGPAGLSEAAGTRAQPAVRS